MAEAETIVESLLGSILILLTLIIPLPIKEEYRLFIITLIVFTALVAILSRFDKRLKNKEDKVEELNKRFKTMTELNEIKLDIQELKRKVFK